MLFSSLEFLYLFLPTVILVYFISPRRIRNHVLLIASLIFYGFAQPGLLPLMLGVIALDFCAGLFVAKSMIQGNTRSADRRLAVTCIVNIAILFVFKYLSFAMALLGIDFHLELPVGISFYIFQALSYVIDVRRGEARPQTNALTFATYVSLFPQLIAGPIVRYCQIEDSLSHRRESIRLFFEGFCLFCVGLAKKVLLANSAGEEWSRALSVLRASPNILGAWVGLLFFAFQIYFDFSGDSDMARGLGKIFGFEFPENFRYPYVARSITDFWRRWHITLSAWFREYVYIPLGGNRRGKRRMYIALLITWALTGLWHGAYLNFPLWGLYFFVLIALEKAFLLKLLDRLPSVVCHIYTLLLVLLSWLIFVSDGDTLTLSEGARYLGWMAGVGSALVCTESVFDFLRNAIFLAIMCVACTPIASKTFQTLGAKAPRWRTVISGTLSIISLLLCTAKLTQGSYNPFLYFRF